MSLERHAPDLSLEILVTYRRFPRLLSRVNYRHSEAVSELASDYSGCSSLIVSATSPANREESFSSGTVALDHELTKTFGEEGVYRRTRRVQQVAVIVSSGTGFIKTGQRDGEENKHYESINLWQDSKYIILKYLRACTYAYVYIHIWANILCIIWSLN